MAGLYSIDCELYRIEKKVKMGQHAYKEVWKKWRRGAFLKQCIEVDNIFNIVQYF